MVRIILMLSVCVVVAGGCSSSAYHRLVSEDDVPTLRRLKDDGAQLPWKTSLVPTSRQDELTIGVAVHETGRLDAESTIVLLHGTVSDHETWRFLLAPLGDQHRLLLIDLPGCGHSDKPPPEHLKADGYGPDALAHRVHDALASSRLLEHGDGPITLVGHSLGGLVALRMLTDPALRAVYGEQVQMFDGLVLLNAVDLEVVQPNETMMKLATSSELVYELATATGILRDAIAQSALKTSSKNTPPLREEADRRVDILSRPETRQVAKAMLRLSTPRTQEGLQWAAVRAFDQDCRQLQTPCLVLWGEQDAILPASIGYRLAARLPNASIHVEPGVHHSWHLESPTTCSQRISTFVGSLQQLQSNAE